MNKNNKTVGPMMNRRRFLSTTGVMAVGASAALLGGGLFAPDSFAAQQIGKDANATLLKMARDIYPHDTLENKYYSQVMDPMAKGAESDPELLKLLSEGVAQLDKVAMDKFGKKYAAIAKETDRVAVLKTIESSPFFQKIKGALMMGIYNNPELWPRFGYGGSAWEKGGYINRGYNDIDWL
ncbi:Twin-arginine translocation pathway signal [Pontibacter sp. JAM-7]|uniref:Twin-arginine translocation pathway signal n=1 Tax=Pontibacter sp. JAM-7 TaxID=3366581 RepID=UPI003AF6AB67